MSNLFEISQNLRTILPEIVFRKYWEKKTILRRRWPSFQWRRKTRSLLVQSRYHPLSIGSILISWGNSQIILNPFTRPGKHTKNYGKSPFLMGKLTISMAMFQFANCKRLPGRVNPKNLPVRFPLFQLGCFASSGCRRGDCNWTTGNRPQTADGPPTSGLGEYRGKTTDANGHATGTDWLEEPTIYKAYIRPM